MLIAAPSGHAASTSSFLYCILFTSVILEFSAILKPCVMRLWQKERSKHMKGACLSSTCRTPHNITVSETSWGAIDKIDYHSMYRRTICICAMIHDERLLRQCDDEWSTWHADDGTSYTSITTSLLAHNTNRTCKRQTHIWKNGVDFRCLELAGILSCILQVFGLQAVCQRSVILDYLCTSNTNSRHIQSTEYMHRLCITAQLYAEVAFSNRSQGSSHNPIVHATAEMIMHMHITAKQRLTHQSYAKCKRQQHRLHLSHNFEGLSMLVA